MKKILTLLLLCLGVAVTVFTACRKDEERGTPKAEQLVLPPTAYDYVNDPMPLYASQAWGITNNTATLGRVLFYDKVLSINNSVACATCHKQQFAFSDNTASSIGFTDMLTPRNSMAIMNTGQTNGYFWDIREQTLESMVIKPVQNHIEMGFDNMQRVVSKMQEIPYYKDLFEKAYGSSKVSEQDIAKALAAFVASMRSYQSKYDVGVANNFVNFNALEQRGKSLFIEKLHCNHCHTTPNCAPGWGFTANIGLDEVYADKGRTFQDDVMIERAGVEGMFKVPTLRNIELTAPYMHDGRFNTLEEVVEHYNSGVRNHKYLDWIFKVKNLESFNMNKMFPGNNAPVEMSETPVPLNLSDYDKQALVAFLKTLTDHRFITDPKFSNPFQVSY